MKKVFSVFIIILFSKGTAFAQKNNIQLAPFSVESVKYFNIHHPKASSVYRIFYERSLSNHFSTICGLGYLNNTVTAPLKSRPDYLVTFDQKQFEAQIGLKYSFSKKTNLLNPFIEQDFFYKNGQLDGEFSTPIFIGSSFEQSSKATSLGTRTRVGLEVKLSNHFFGSLNSGVAFGFGSITYDFSEVLIWDPYYGSNFIISEFRFGYRF